jgi:phosphate transport system substrate-binding protein
MRVQRMIRALLYGVVFLGTIGVVLSPAYAQTKLVKIDGSSTVYPATEAVAEEFQRKIST